MSTLDCGQEEPDCSTFHPAARRRAQTSSQSQKELSLDLQQMVRLHRVLIPTSWITSYRPGTLKIWSRGHCWKHSDFKARHHNQLCWCLLASVESRSDQVQDYKQGGGKKGFLFSLIQVVLSIHLEMDLCVCVSEHIRLCCSGGLNKSHMTDALPLSAFYL